MISSGSRKKYTIRTRAGMSQPFGRIPVIFGWFDIAVPFRDLIFIPVGLSQGDKADQGTFFGRILKKQGFFQKCGQSD